MSFCPACATQRTQECLAKVDKAEKGFPWIRTIFCVAFIVGLIWLGLSFYRAMAPVLPSFATLSSELKELPTDDRAIPPPLTAAPSTVSVKESSAPWLTRVLSGYTQRSVEDAGRINLLFVTRPGTDACRGLSSQLFITRESVQTAGADLATAVGSDMRTSFDEGLRYVRKQSRDWERQFSVRLSFEDKFTSKDGGSAGTAFTVAILGATRHIELDPTVAMTGDLTVDGTVQPVGCVVEKLRGAIDGGCKVTLVPDRNSRDVFDLALLDGTAPLWETQVFSISTVDEAFSLTRKDRAENVRKAMEKFAALRARLPKVVTPNYLASPIVQNELQDILKLAPNHLSAKVLFGAATNTNSPSLSLNRSVNEILSASYFFLGDSSKGQGDFIPAADSGDVEFPARECEQCIQRLRKVTPILDSRSLELKNCCMTVTGLLRTVWDDTRTALSPSAYRLSAQHQFEMQKMHGQDRQELGETLTRLHLALRKLDVDGSLISELRKK